MGLEAYCAEIGKMGLLTPEEERKFGRLAMAGDENARRRLVEGNLRLVVCIAKKYCGMGLDMEDLVSIGNMGLMRAAQKFDAGRETRFSTYCALWVKAYIRAELRRRMHTPEATAKSIEEELAGDGGGNSVRLVDLLAHGDPTASERAVIEEQRERAVMCMKNVLAHCKQRDREIFEKRLGLNGGQPLKLRQLSDQYGITDSAIDAMVKRLLAKMRKQLEAPK